MKHNLKTFPEPVIGIHEHGVQSARAFMECCLRWKEDFEQQLRQLKNNPDCSEAGPCSIDADTNEIYIKINEVLGDSEVGEG